MHVCEIRCKAVEVVKLSSEMVHLLIVFQHADDIKSTAKDPLYEGFIGKPCVHQDIFCRNANLQCTFYHSNSSVRFLHHCCHPGFVAICTPVYFGIDLTKAVFLFGRRQHVKGNRDETITICPSKHEQIETTNTFANNVIKYKCQKFNFFTPFTGNDRIIKDKRPESSRGRKGVKKDCHLC